MGPPTVSVILPTFNRLKLLRPAVESVFAQTFRDWHLIVADDGSEGETARFLTSLGAEPRVTVLRLAHRGNPAAVRNAALREARAEYVAFLDSDDLWLPEKLEVQLGVQRARPGRRWSYCAEYLMDAQGRSHPGQGADGRALAEGAIFEKLLNFEASLSTPCVLAERSLIEEVGGFDEGLRYWEDYDLWVRLSLRSEVAAISQPLVRVRSHAEHYSADRPGVYEARFLLLEKIARLASTPRQHALLRRERARTAAALATVHASLGARGAALAMLWRSRSGAWHDRDWWPRAARTLARALAPSWLRGRLRRLRARGRRNAAAP
jgi:glycosyltransferase involved in cell wall biosynthesis